MRHKAIRDGTLGNTNTEKMDQHELIKKTEKMEKKENWKEMVNWKSRNENFSRVRNYL